MLVPVLALFIRNLWSAVLLFVAAATFAYPASQLFMSLYSGIAVAKAPMFEQFVNVISFLPQIPAFAGGILLYFIWRTGFRLNRFAAASLLGASVAVAWILSTDIGYWFGILGHTVQFTNLTLSSVAMVPGVAALVLCPSLPLNNRAARYIGRLSYSIYLLHFAMITVVVVGLRSWTSFSISTPGDWNFLVFTGTTLVTCILPSILTHKYIEEPGQHLVVRLLIRRGGRNAALTAQPVIPTPPVST